MKKLITLFMCFCTYAATAQITGTVTDSNGEPLIGVSILEKGTYSGTTTGLDGSFSLTTVTDNPVLVFSSVGYGTQEVMPDGGALNVIMEEGSTLNEVVVTGTRGKPRTVLGSAVPIDNINAAELRKSGQTSLDQIINFKVPSYNSSNMAISDASAHIDPSELRNLGPSRTLVLVNGKRKNQSSQVYLNDTPGRGEVGTDMKSIPAAAIERVEVLRDGAAAQYGSDAIAGVINVILKERTEGQVNVQYGVTAEGDGTTYGVDVNKGIKIGNSGFLNFTGEYSYQDVTDRAGEFADEVGDPLFGIPLGTSPELDAYFRDYPDLGITYGQPEITKLSAMLNFGTSYSGGKGKLYGNWGYTGRSGKSFAFYRTWYWRETDWGKLTDSGDPYIGYQPTFETDISDITFTLGTQNKFAGLNSDLSFTYGGNTIDYTVNNSLNRSLAENSPTSFNPGGYSFENQVVNWDLSKSMDALSLAFGVEYRRELFETRAGEEASYSPAPGTDSFPGLTPDNAVDENRNNVGVYLSADYDISEEFLFGGAVRFENYSDFGSNFSWKANTRYLIGESGAVRASVSTGFRAPSLHQIYLSNIQTTAGASGLIQEGTFSNVDDITRNVLGVPQLDAETSFNYTAGFTFKIADNVSLSADYYNITVNDRVLFSDQIGASNFEGSALGDALASANVEAFKFFINAADTKTSGVDIVLNADNFALGDGGNNFDITLAANFNSVDIDGQITAPAAFGDVSIFGDTPANLLTNARPNSKIALGLNFDIGKIGVTLNNTRFGEVNSPTTGQEFGSKIVTDLLLNYDVTDALRLGITVNNLLDVYPDRIDGELDAFGYRLQYPWRVNQFGFNGRYMKVRLTYDF